MTAEVQQFPHLKVLDRVLGLPVVELALAKSAETYSKVKDSNMLMHWAFATAEMSMSIATKQAVPIAAPIVSKFKTPLYFVDNVLCSGLNKIEEKVPLVKETPAQILEKAVSTISHVNDVIVTQATNLRDFSWYTANQILDTHYGTAAVKGLDSTAIIVDQLIDKYFPATAEEKVTAEVNAIERDKLLHTLQTVGHLSNKAARRVYSNIVYHLNTDNENGLLRNYVNSLLEFLRLTRYLHKVNEVNEEKSHMNGEKKEEPERKKPSKEDSKENSKKDSKKESKGKDPQKKEPSLSVEKKND